MPRTPSSVSKGRKKIVPPRPAAPMSIATNQPTVSGPSRRRAKKAPRLHPLPGEKPWEYELRQREGVDEQIMANREAAKRKQREEEMEEIRQKMMKLPEYGHWDDDGRWISVPSQPLPSSQIPFDTKIGDAPGHDLAASVTQTDQEQAFSQQSTGPGRHVVSNATSASRASQKLRAVDSSLASQPQQDFFVESHHPPQGEDPLFFSNTQNNIDPVSQPISRGRKTPSSKKRPIRALSSTPAATTPTLKRLRRRESKVRPPTPASPSTQWSAAPIPSLAVVPDSVDYPDTPLATPRLPQEDIMIAIDLDGNYGDHRLRVAPERVRGHEEDEPIQRHGPQQPTFKEKTYSSRVPRTHRSAPNRPRPPFTPDHSQVGLGEHRDWVAPAADSNIDWDDLLPLQSQDKHRASSLDQTQAYVDGLFRPDSPPSTRSKQLVRLSDAYAPNTGWHHQSDQTDESSEDESGRDNDKENDQENALPTADLRRSRRVAKLKRQRQDQLRRERIDMRDVFSPEPESEDGAQLLSVVQPLEFTQTTQPPPLSRFDDGRNYARMPVRRKKSTKLNADADRPQPHRDLWTQPPTYVPGTSPIARISLAEYKQHASSPDYFATDHRLLKAVKKSSKRNTSVRQRRQRQDTGKANRQNVLAMHVNDARAPSEELLVFTPSAAPTSQAPARQTRRYIPLAATRLAHGRNVNAPSAFPQLPFTRQDPRRQIRTHNQPATSESEYSSPARCNRPRPAAISREDAFDPINPASQAAEQDWVDLGDDSTVHEMAILVPPRMPAPSQAPKRRVFPSPPGLPVPTQVHPTSKVFETTQLPSRLPSSSQIEAAASQTLTNPAARPGPAATVPTAPKTLSGDQLTNLLLAQAEASGAGVVKGRREQKLEERKQRLVERRQQVTERRDADQQGTNDDGQEPITKRPGSGMEGEGVDKQAARQRATDPENTVNHVNTASKQLAENRVRATQIPHSKTIPSKSTQSHTTAEPVVHSNNTRQMVADPPNSERQVTSMAQTPTRTRSQRTTSQPSLPFTNRNTSQSSSATYARPTLSRSKSVYSPFKNPSQRADSIADRFTQHIHNAVPSLSDISDEMTGAPRRLGMR